MNDDPRVGIDIALDLLLLRRKFATFAAEAKRLDLDDEAQYCAGIVNRIDKLLNFPCSTGASKLKNNGARVTAGNRPANIL